MFNTNDVFLKVGRALSNQNFYDLGIEEQKQLVEKEIACYIKEKVGTIEKATLDEIVEELGKKLSDSDKEKLLKSCTHCLLNIAGNMQNWSIVWFEEKEEPSILFTKEGKWDNLTTRQDDLIENKFMFALDIFRNYFFNKHNKICFMAHNAHWPYVEIEGRNLGYEVETFGSSTSYLKRGGKKNSTYDIILLSNSNPYKQSELDSITKMAKKISDKSQKEVTIGYCYGIPMEKRENECSQEVIIKSINKEEENTMIISTNSDFSEIDLLYLAVEKHNGKENEHLGKNLQKK